MRKLQPSKDLKFPNPKKDEISVNYGSEISEPKKDHELKPAKDQKFLIT